MNNGSKKLLNGWFLAAAMAVTAPGLAYADRDDRSRRGDHDDNARRHYYDRVGGDRHDRDRDRNRVVVPPSPGGWVNVDVRSGGPTCAPPAYVERSTQVWVEPVYRTVCDRVWVAPVYKDVCERVWREPVVEKRIERVWVPERRELRSVWRGRCMVQEWVIIPGHYETVCRDVVVCPGRWEDVRRQVLVAEGHWQTVERQELVCAGHWETRVERVAVAAAPPAVREGLRIDLRLPVWW